MRVKSMIIAAVAMAAMAAGSTAVMAPAADAATNAVSPRSACGGFNGNIEWHVTDPFGDGEIHVWGQLWDNNCPGSTEQLWVKYIQSDGGGYQFWPITSVGYPGTIGVNTGPVFQLWNYTSIGIYVCQVTSAGQRSCGPTVNV